MDITSLLAAYGAGPGAGSNQTGVGVGTAPASASNASPAMQAMQQQIMARLLSGQGGQGQAQSPMSAVTSMMPMVAAQMGQQRQVGANQNAFDQAMQYYQNMPMQAPGQ